MDIQRIKNKIQKQDIAIKIFDRMDKIWNYLQEEPQNEIKETENKHNVLKTIAEIESLLNKLKKIL